MKNLLLILSLLSALLLAFYAGHLSGIQTVITQSWFYITELPEDGTDLFITLPDGNTYCVELFVC